MAENEYNKNKSIGVKTLIGNWVEETSLKNLVGQDLLSTRNKNPEVGKKRVFGTDDAATAPETWKTDAQASFDNPSNHVTTRQLNKRDQRLYDEVLSKTIAEKKANKKTQEQKRLAAIDKERFGHRQVWSKEKRMQENISHEDKDKIYTELYTTDRPITVYGTDTYKKCPVTRKSLELF
eukprot:195404_1